jgi:glyoxylase I family protein
MGHAESFIQVTVNCTDLERSKTFYEMLGFKVLDKMGSARVKSTGALLHGDAMGMKEGEDIETVGYLLGLGDFSQKMYIDLLRWDNPRVEGKPYPTLNHSGVARICLSTKDIQKAYEDLKSKGVRFITEPRLCNYPKWHMMFVLFEDPDGNFLEFIEGPVFH